MNGLAVVQKTGKSGWSGSKLMSRARLEKSFNENKPVRPALGR